MYRLVNTNFIIPSIIPFNTFEESIEELQYETISRTSEYNNKIYVINVKEQNIIYTSDDKNIYSNDLKYGNKKIIYTYEKINYIGNEYWKKFNIFDLNDDNKFVDMSLTIKEKKINNVKFEYEKYEKCEINNNELTTQSDTSITNSNKINNVNFEYEKCENNKNDNNKLTTQLDTSITSITSITNSKNNIIVNVESPYDTDNKIKNYDADKEEKKNKIIKMIGEVNELYQKEMIKIKKLELNLKSYESKLNKLEKKKKDLIVDDIIRTQGDYRTWKKIKYGLKNYNNELDVLKPIDELEESHDIVPILFLSKYNYIEKIQKNVYISKLLDKINNLNLNILNDSEILPSDIVQFSNKYMGLSKELHYQFDDHEWSYLENEINLNSTNKLVSNVVTSSLIE